MKSFKYYYELFSDEHLCVRILKAVKEQQGVVCGNCGNDEHYWKNDKKKYECKDCNYRTSLKKGTVMEHSNLPMQYWLSIIAYLILTNEKISTLKLQKEIGHNRYEPILRMVKKIKGMSNSDLLKKTIMEYLNKGNYYENIVSNRK